MNLRTKAKAESELGEFFGEYIREWHPCKDDQGENLFPFVQEILAEPELAQPQCTNLLAVLDEIFDVDQPSVNLRPLARLVTALIEDSQRHTGHGTQAPVLGTDPCARKGSSSRGTSYVYCRYLFPRLLRLLDALLKGVVLDDPHRPGLRNLFLDRNDSLLNLFEEHLFLANGGNIGWRALLNLWAVLEYLTKYANKAGKGSASLGLSLIHI